MKNIQIQKSNSAEQETIEIEKNMVIVGANGAGKSRLGSNLEQINSPTKRISAQRYLQLNEVVEKKDFETAKTELKGSHKNQPPIQPQNDYQQVLISLFAQEAQRNEEYVASSRPAKRKLKIPKSVKEKVIDCWKFIFPYRTLKLDNDRVRADSFSGTEMSDGEKVGLYLISQVLLVEQNCILIVDEPELHLHKALMVRLWNKLEEYRSDCLFIYITHDLDFAVSKPSSKLVWVKEYQNNQWNWIEVVPNEIIPENLYLEILGSRKPILLVEGKKGSLDIKLYQAYYPNLTVIPGGSCEEIIASVKGLRSNIELHDKKVFGLIDRDFRPNSQISAFKKKGIFSISLNKIENIFLLPEILEIVCIHLSKPEKKEEMLEEIRKKYKKNKVRMTFFASRSKMHRHIGEKFGVVKSKTDYDKFKRTILNQLDKLATDKFPKDDANITDILKVYTDKGLVKEIQGKIDLSGDQYRNLVFSFFSSDEKRELLKVLKKYLPKIK